MTEPCSKVLVVGGCGGRGDGVPKGAGVLTTRTRYSREMYRQRDGFSIVLSRFLSHKTSPPGYLPPEEVTLTPYYFKNIMCKFEGQNRRTAMNKRTKVAPRQNKKQRPCSDCHWFRLLSGRIGVCRTGEHPSKPMECPSYKGKQ